MKFIRGINAQLRDLEQIVSFQEKYLDKYARALVAIHALSTRMSTSEIILSEIKQVLKSVDL